MLLASTSASDDPCGGIILDAVNVQPVPEPTADPRRARRTCDADMATMMIAVAIGPRFAGS